MRKSWTVTLIGVAVLCAAAAIVLWPARHNQSVTPASNAANAPIPVMVAAASKQDVPIILRGLGNVSAYNTVTVRSRVAGAITHINFREGQEVKEGELLLQLDARPFQAALDQANANLARDQATLANAQRDFARIANLKRNAVTTQQQYDTQQALVASAAATVQADQAAVSAAKLNVEFASIRAPITGIIGIRPIDIGNLVEANTQTLAVVTQIKPIYVVFALPETEIARIRGAMAKGRLATVAYDPADQEPISRGVLDLIDNQVDATTGTVKLKAEFPNQDAALWPGQFVNAHLVLQVVNNGVTIPAAAVQSGAQGSFVYVVTPEQTAEVRPVSVLQTENNTSLIGSGLSGGELVVTAGHFRLTPGAKVSVPNPRQASSSGAAAPASK